MSLSILNNISAIYAENNLNNTQASLQTVLQQLSSGSRINSGADDAAGLAISNGLQANVAALTQSAQNASDGINLLSTADGALSQVTNLLDRAVTLATEAANGTLSGTQVSSANQEYQSIITEIGNIGSTTNFNGNNVFSNTATQLYVGDGTSSGSNIYTDVTGGLSINSVGQSAPSSTGVAIAAPTTPANPTTAVATTSGTTPGTGSVPGVATYTFNSGNDAVSGTIGFAEAGATTSAGITHTFTGGPLTLAQAVAQINADTTFSSNNVTASVSSGNKILLTDTSGLNVGTTVTSPGTSITDQHLLAGSSTYTLNNANDTLAGTLAFQQGTTTASINLQPGTTLQQAIAAINASGSTFQTAGIQATAYVAGATTLVLTNINAASPQQGLSTTNTGTTLTDTQATQALVVPGLGSSPAANASSTLAFHALQNATDDIVGTLKIAVGTTGSAISVQFQPGTTLSAAVSQLNNNAQLKAAGISASAASSVLTLTGPVSSAGGAAYQLDSAGTSLYDTAAVAGPGAGTDFTSASLSTLTTLDAQNVLTGVNAAIANVSYQRGILGAYSNQLTAASNTAASENVNLTAAQSSILSTNYGQATSDLAKYEVLSQTGISALAQANTVQQEILKLLQ